MSYSRVPTDEESNKRNNVFGYNSFPSDRPSAYRNDESDPGQSNSFGMYKKLSIAALGTIVVIGCVASFSTQKPSSSSTMLMQKPVKVKASSSKPNFVFILADDVGWNSIGYEDYDLAFATPYMTALAGKGIIFSNYYSQEVCTPARAALMTGRYPATLGMQYGEIMPTENLALEIEETLLPEVLRENGYKNYAIGKWNLGHYNPQYLPTARGFDYFLGYMDGHNYYWSKRDPGAPSYYDFMYADTSCYELYDGDDMETYSTTLYKNMAVRAIENHDFDSNPMFLYLPFQAAHDPFADYKDSHPDGLNDTYVGTDRYEEVLENVVGTKRQQYAMALMMLDDAVNDIYNALDAAGQLDNTYIMFASDNGGCYNAGGRNGPLRGSKGSLFEGGTKVDAFVYSPLLAGSSGSTYTGLMHVSDWFSTILSWAGMSYTADTGFAVDSISHASALKALKAKSDSSSGDDDALPVREYMLYNVYLNVDGQDFDIATNAPFAIRNGQYKLMHGYTENKQSTWYTTDDEVVDDDSLGEVTSCSQSTASTGTYSKFLFDLVNDPYETTNLYSNDTYQLIRAELYDYLDVSTVKLESSYYSYAAAYKQWKANSHFIQPWNFTELTTSSRAVSYPSLCSSSGIFSPTWNGN